VGCLCNYKLLDYVDNVPNWQVGWATTETFASGDFAVDFARVIGIGWRHKVLWRGACVDAFTSRPRGR